MAAYGLFPFSLLLFLRDLRAWPKVKTVSGLGKMDKWFEDLALGWGMILFNVSLFGQKLSFQSGSPSLL